MSWKELRSLTFSDEGIKISRLLVIHFNEIYLLIYIFMHIHFQYVALSI